ncbi:hypothetical protein I5M27_04570 [Adhaeribacter sp. BT258]|uniref:Outer membrane protein beta-barrel domain-containing protein n=1 Tax=Adhaeribacter terrigena TaxID=2793070 RepID=A0ABS1C144_9BACT|nr:hypothetical protein [Adhaeribacter terrigena]MBK0402245.1 hypothetical protein [Adhaeribacter terrigena]
MKNTGLLFILLFGLLVQAFAQEDSTKNNVFGGFLIMPIEFPVINTKGLDQQLSKYGFPKANHATANVGIGLQLYMNRGITTFSYNQTTKKNDQSSFVTEVEYRSTSFNFGYSLTKSPWFSVYPYTGFKGVGLNYLYREKATDTTSFGNYLQSNLRYKEVTNSKAHLDLGIGISHQMFYLINFRFGYLLPLERVRWNINNNKTTLPNSPEVAYNYYFTLTLGLGNIARDNDVRRHYNRR